MLLHFNMFTPDGLAIAVRSTGLNDRSYSVIRCTKNIGDYEKGKHYFNNAPQQRMDPKHFVFVGLLAEMKLHSTQIITK